MQMTFYEGHGPNRELTALAQQRPTAILEAMVQTLRAARWSGYLKPDADLPVLADRLVQVMLRVGLDVIRFNASADKLAELLCRILLEGMAAVATHRCTARQLRGVRRRRRRGEVMER